MKKLLTLIALIALVASVNAQVSGTVESKQVQPKWKPFNPDSIARVHYNLKNDTARIFYWVYRIEDGKTIYQKRYHDCYVPFSKKDLQDLNTEFNAWIREKYNIE